MVHLAEDRREVWTLLRDMAGLKTPEEMAIDADAERQMDALRAEYEAKLADLRARYPQVIARRLAESLLQAGNGVPGVADLLAGIQAAPTGALLTVPRQPVAPTTAAAAVATATAPAVAAPQKEAPLSMEPYIDLALCTACNECTNLNKRMFAYNDKKQAYIKDPHAGSFKQLVQAAEKCPVKIIHPGTPLNPKEKDLDKWVKRAQPFN
jgi:pyruvate-ferredoxin/flavodoxin oxidoreductase